MTLTANELRIGNLVYYCDEVAIVDVNSIKLVTINHKGFSPIPLTEEWLVKLGFEKYGNGLNAIFHIKTIEFISHPFNDVFYMRNSPCTVHIKSIHQLQNLYFALTGKELIYER